MAGGGYSVGVHCSALQSVHMAGMAIFLALWAWPVVSGGSRGKSTSGEGHWMPWIASRRRER